MLSAIFATSTGDNVVGLVLAVAAAIYLVFVLVFPEKF
jgi:K+-transporting ATPase KdpF subunit